MWCVFGDQNCKLVLQRLNISREDKLRPQYRTDSARGVLHWGTGYRTTEITQDDVAVMDDFCQCIDCHNIRSGCYVL